MLNQAVFLVGGLGTRLGETTRTTPKPLLEVAGRPFIEYLIDEAARHGLRDILLLAGHLGAQFESRYAGVRRHGATVRVLRETEPLGTAGAVRRVVPELDDTFLLGNGDTFFDINLLTVPAPDAGEASIALRAAAAGGRYGTVAYREGYVTGFHEPAQGVPGPINAGLYLMSRQVVAGFADGPGSIERDHFPRLARERRLRGAIYDGYFIDIGVPADLERARRELARQTRRPAVFFDRDGVLNMDRGYVHRPEEFEWLPGAREAIRLCNDRGFLAFVVTNQAGVAHGRYDEEAVHSLHRWMDGELALRGAHVDAYEYCPHHPQGAVERYRKACDRRKPGPGMLRDLLAAWPVDAPRSFLVGNQPADVEAARAAGIAGHLYTGGDLRELIAALMR